MNLIAFLIFALSSIGMTHILVDGKIFANFRKWIEARNITVPIFKVSLYDLISCYQCAGLWVGMFCGVLTMRCYGLPWCVEMIPFVFLLGLAGSFLAKFSDALMSYFTLTIDIPLDEEEIKPTGN